MELVANSLEDLKAIADKIVHFIGDGKIVLLEGQMGAGKTTLTKAICENLQVEDNISSPTYSIANEYQTKYGQTIYHFDFYRLEDESEALDIGTEEYFESGNLCLIEWSERVSSLIPDNYIRIEILPQGDQKRLFKLSSHG